MIARIEYVSRVIQEPRVVHPLLADHDIRVTDRHWLATHVLLIRNNCAFLILGVGSLVLSIAMENCALRNICGYSCLMRLEHRLLPRNC